MDVKQKLGRWTSKAYELMWRLIVARRTVIMPPPPVDADRFSPVFLIGCPRSGTTLLRVMLDSHPSLASPPETFFLLDLEKVWISEDGMKGLHEMGYDCEHVRRKLRELSAYFLQGYAHTHHKRRVVEKTPHYVDCLDFIEDLFAPRCHYLMLYRHPLDVVVSMVNHVSIGWQPLLREYLANEPDPHVGYARFWADHVNKMLAFEAAQRDRAIRVRYEDIVADPARQLRGLLEFIGEPWSDDLLTYYERPHDLGGGDRKALLQKGIVPSVDNWRSLDPLLLEKLQAIVREPAERLGYAFERGEKSAKQRSDLAEVASGGNPW